MDKGGLFKQKDIYKTHPIISVYSLMLRFILLTAILFFAALLPAQESVRIVPNPCYELSNYIPPQYQHVNVLNLPAECVVEIFTLNGKSVRTFVQYLEGENLDWDLRDRKGDRIASGVYLLNVTDFKGDTLSRLRFAYFRSPDSEGF